jgi:outer membrane biosynthesis protein TonB
LKRFWKAGLIFALVLSILSGCVITGVSSITINVSGNSSSESLQYALRYSDGEVALKDIAAANNSSFVINTDPQKFIVGGYMSDGNVSWVPDISYFISTVNITNPESNKPNSPVGHVIANEPVIATDRPGFVKVTFDVYGTDGELVTGRTEVFAHSSKNVTFYNTDVQDTDVNRTNEVNEGFSSYTVNGKVTFLIKSNNSDYVWFLPLTLYSGQQVIYESTLNEILDSVVIGFADGDSKESVTENLNLPTTGYNDTSILWESSDPASITPEGVVHRIGNDVPVTLTAKVTMKNGDRWVSVNKRFDVVVSRTLRDVSALETLELDNITLNPEWNSNVYDYTETVPASVTATSVTYETVDSEATAQLFLNDSPASNPVNLNEGENVIKVIVTAEDGSTQAYSVTVDREVQPTPTPGTTPTPTVAPTPEPTVAPTTEPTAEPTIEPTTEPTTKPTTEPTTEPTAEPTVAPTPSPTSSSGDSYTGPVTTPAPTASPAPTPTATPAPTASPAVPETKTFSSVIKDTAQLVSILKETLEANKDAKTSFGDTGSHWAANDIALASRLQIITGYQDGSFKPNASVSRGEFSAMIARAFHLEAGQTQVSFKDLEGQSWSKAAIELLASNGIISGYQDGTFRSTQEITRAEMLTMISRILNLKALNQSGAVATFSDINNGYWAKQTIEDATAAGLVKGVSTDKFAPEGKASRAEVVSLIIRSLKTDKSIQELLK